MQNNKGMIFDIVRCSYVDGPGIRTTVFFKGCNLKCEWCHNPESQSPEKQIMFFKNKCTGCGKCREVCPNNLKKCNFCGECELYCPNDARKICGKEMTVDEVFSEILRDKAFYENSGGGVTFSGGECMLQINFLKEVLEKCRKENIHTAVDSAGNVPWEYFTEITPYTDLFLYDIKLADSEKHKKYTGADNRKILKNLELLLDANMQVIIRIPVIGGVNDNAAEMTAIKELVSRLGSCKTELLPYHAMGKHKYTALGKGEPSGFEVSAEKLEVLREIFR